MRTTLLVILLVMGNAGCSTEGDANPADPLTCSPENCAGCCDANGVCQPGLSTNTCGTEGNACEDCSAEGGICSANTCQVVDCETAEANPDLFPCNFCTPEGTGIQHCAFCHREKGAVDNVELCDPGETCYMVTNLLRDDLQAACFSQEPVECDPTSYEDHCQGMMATNCSAEGLETYDDCTQYPDHICELVTIFDGSIGAQCIVAESGN